MSDDYYRDSAGRIFPLPSTTPEFQKLVQAQEELQIAEFERNLTGDDKQFLSALHISLETRSAYDRGDK